MSLKLNATSSRTGASASLLHVLQMLLLLSLLLTSLVPTTMGQHRRNSRKDESTDMYIELRCVCVKTVSGIHPSNIQNLEVIRPGAYCDKVQVIATLKDGRKTCLDPEAPGVKKMLRKILEGH